MVVGENPTLKCSLNIFDQMSFDLMSTNGIIATCFTSLTLSHWSTIGATFPNLTQHHGMLAKLMQTNIQELLAFQSLWIPFGPSSLTFLKNTYISNILTERNIFCVWERKIQAQNELHKILHSPSLLAHYDPKAKIELKSNASNQGQDCFLVQMKNWQQ